MKGKRVIVIGALVISIVILSNTPPLKYLLDYAFDYTHYRYANASGSFYRIDRSGNNVKGMELGFKEFVKTKNPPASDAVLYRLFWKNPLAFWRWSTYYSDDARYLLPYKRGV